MRNKGAILTLAIALALVCIYQLSFTWKAVSVRNQAVVYATDPSTNTIDEIREQYFLDSVSNEKIFFFDLFTYRDCLEREINFGLDLKGGMNIILGISINDVIRNLSSSPADTTLNRALALAKERQKNSSEDFIVLFGKAFDEIAPGASLKSLFLTKELSDRISFEASNQEVISVLDKETKGAIDNAFNIIRTRIDQFGVAQPNIQRLETTGRILVDLPGVKDRERVRKLLQGTANLEFWEVYENSAETQQILLAVNEMVKLQNEIAKKDTTAVETLEQTLTDDGGKDTLTTPSLLADVQADTNKSREQLSEDVYKEYPLFALMQPIPMRDQQSAGPVTGISHFKDTAKVNSYLTQARERNIIPRDMRFMWSAKALTGDDKKPTNNFELYAIKVTGREGRAPLDGDVITSARQDFDEGRGSAYVSMTMNGEGSTVWARLTRENVGQAIAIVMDNKVFSAPVVQNEITGGSSQITGNFTIQEADDLANLLKSGKLPAPARIIQETVVGPTLGKEAVSSGLNSFAIAFVIVLVYMLFYYSRNAGLVADIALIVNLFFLIGVLASLGAALTLPGIAGIVLTMGMAVDSNVLIFERIREEVAAGKGLKLAVKDGFRNAYSAIIDSNVTTIVTGLILLLFGTGPIKGFATTLVIGILTSLFTSIFISRLLIEAFLSKNNDFKFTTSYTDGAFKNAKIKFIEGRKISYVLSSALIIISLYSIFLGRGLDLGVDFKGGRNFIIRFEQPVENSKVAQLLAPTFGETPSVITFGEVNQVRITTLYKLEEEGTDVDETIQQEMFTALKPILGEKTDYANFVNTNWQGNQKVGATIADDIKRESVFVFLGAILFMFLYIFIRFRNWQFGLGAIVTLVHDSLIVLGMFSLLHGVLPFSLEIDQAFIAAILTVIGYSVNDTVIVYDRIREFTHLYPKRDRLEIFNGSMNATLSRTVNTSLTTLLVLVVIFILGGESIQGFALSLLVGIGVGTYSSVFVAAPVVYDTIRIVKSKKKEN